MKPCLILLDSRLELVALRPHVPERDALDHGRELLDRYGGPGYRVRFDGRDLTAQLMPDTSPRAERVAVIVLDDQNRLVTHRGGVPAGDAFAVGVRLRDTHAMPHGRVLIDGRDVTRALPAAPGPSAWKFLLDDPVLRRVPVVDLGRGDPRLQSGRGPGGLVWAPWEDEGCRGLRASRWRHAFTILQLSAGQCVLFHERAAGDWDALALGAAETLKARAAAWLRPEPPAPPPPLPFHPNAIRLFLRATSGKPNP